VFVCRWQRPPGRSRQERRDAGAAHLAGASSSEVAILLRRQQLLRAWRRSSRLAAGASRTREHAGARSAAAVSRFHRVNASRRLSLPLDDDASFLRATPSGMPPVRCRTCPRPNLVGLAQLLQPRSWVVLRWPDGSGCVKHEPWRIVAVPGQAVPPPSRRHSASARPRRSRFTRPVAARSEEMARPRRQCGELRYRLAAVVSVGEGRMILRRVSSAARRPPTSESRSSRADVSGGP
jgi:hypothetical protein